MSDKLVKAFLTTVKGYVSPVMETAKHDNEIEQPDFIDANVDPKAFENVEL